MTVLWEVPVVDRAAMLPRRLLRERLVVPELRDAPPRRVRRERLPEHVRTWGASSRKIATPRAD